MCRSDCWATHNETETQILIANTFQMSIRFSVIKYTCARDLASSCFCPYVIPCGWVFWSKIKVIPPISECDHNFGPLKITLAATNIKAKTAHTHTRAHTETKNRLRQNEYFFAISISSLLVTEWVTWPKLFAWLNIQICCNSFHLLLRWHFFPVLSFIFRPGHSMCWFFSVSFVNGMQILFDFIWNMLFIQRTVLHNNSTKYTVFIVASLNIVWAGHCVFMRLCLCLCMFWMTIWVVSLSPSLSVVFYAICMQQRYLARQVFCYAYFSLFWLIVGLYWLIMAKTIILKPVICIHTYELGRIFKHRILLKGLFEQY